MGGSYSDFNQYLRINEIQNCESGLLTKSQQAPLLGLDPWTFRVRGKPMNRWTTPPTFSLYDFKWAVLLAHISPDALSSLLITHRVHAHTKQIYQHAYRTTGDCEITMTSLPTWNYKDGTSLFTCNWKVPFQIYFCWWWWQGDSRGTMDTGILFQKS